MASKLIERLRVTMHGRDRRFVTSRLRGRFMPAVVIARNTPGTHNNSAVVRSMTQGCTATVRKMEDVLDIDFVTFEIWVLMLAAFISNAYLFGA